MHVVRARISPSYSAAFGLLLALGACKVSDGLAEGDRLAKQGRWTEAVDAYEAVLRDYPHSYRAAWGIAEIYCEKTHHYDKCLRWTERLLEGYPGKAKYRRARAQGFRDRAAYHRSHGDEAAALADEAEAAKYDH